MYAFEFVKPSTVEEAVRALAGGEAQALGGGQTLIPTMKQRLAAPSDLIDLRHIGEMQGITVSGRSVRIGAATTHHEVASSAALKAVCPAICSLAGHIGDPHVRNRGTIGGSLANNDPAADYPAAVLALGAALHTSKRELSADDFFQGLFTTALEEDEILTRILFPISERFAYAKFPNPASRYAMVGVAVAKGSQGVRVAVTGAGQNGVFRVKPMEDALAKSFKPDAVANIKVPADGMLSDIHASAEYRAHLVTVMAKRAVQNAG